jgi:hypothetical protein
LNTFKLRWHAYSLNRTDSCFVVDAKLSILLKNRNLLALLLEGHIQVHMLRLLHIAELALTPAVASSSCMQAQQPCATQSSCWQAVQECWQRCSTFS